MAGPLTDLSPRDVIKSSFNQMQSFVEPINEALTSIPPVQLVTGTAFITGVALTIFNHYSSNTPPWSLKESVGNLALYIPCVRNKYTADMQKQLIHFQETCRKKWEVFGPPITQIPEEGYSLEELSHLISKYSSITANALKGKHISGTIYSQSLDQGYDPLISSWPQPDQTEIQEDEEKKKNIFTFSFSSLSEKLRKAFTQAFSESYLWNSLHSNEFGIGAFINYQVICMVADMFGGKPHQVMGFVTSGGTESLMLAMRAYRDKGIAMYNHKPGDGIILAASSVHAAVLKAGIAYQVQVHPISTDANDKMRIDKLKKAITKYGSRVIAIVGSYPSYPIGVADPIYDMAQLAHAHNIGFHVDACLGAFIFNNTPYYSSNLLELPGVTSLSADTHKNGLGPKGSGVLITPQRGLENLAYYSIYPIPDWSGGVYGTPKDAGSQSCFPAFSALLALLGTGKKGYFALAQALLETAEKMRRTIQQFPNQLKLLSEEPSHVVAFQINKTWGLQTGATYALAHEMAQNGFILNTLGNDRVHFCVTSRFLNCTDPVNVFKKSLEESLKNVEELNQKLVNEGQKFPGDAGMYCSLDSALNPQMQSLSLQDWVEKTLFGVRGAKDNVRAYFLAEMNPYAYKDS